MGQQTVSKISQSFKTNISVINKIDPAVRHILEQGLAHSEIQSQLDDLATIVASLKNVEQSKKPGIGQRIFENLDKIKTVAETYETVKPYATTLIKVLKPFVLTHTGIDLPFV